MGMVMLVEVGKGANADAAKAAKMPPKAKQKFDELLCRSSKERQFTSQGDDGRVFEPGRFCLGRLAGAVPHPLRFARRPSPLKKRGGSRRAANFLSSPRGEV